VLLLSLLFLNPRKNEVGKIKKNTKKFEVKKLVRVVLRGKTVVQQYGVKTLNYYYYYYYYYYFILFIIFIKLKKN